MSRKRKSLPILENVEIESVAAEGKCVAHVNDMVVFVPFVVPGDIVDLQVRKKRHSYCEATVLYKEGFAIYTHHRLQNVRI